MSKIYRVKDVSQIIDRDKTTLFRWEREGKIAHPQRDSRGWRIYTETDLARMRQIISCQSFNLTSGQ
jgi:DNA-binding transcriptional MerR regulator